MAKRIPLDVAFSLVLKNPKIKNMKAGRFGAYVRLCHVAILDGKYPFPVSPSVMARLAGLSRPHWHAMKAELNAALVDTLPVLFERYAREKALQVIRSERTRKNCKAWHDKLKSGIMSGKWGLPKKEAISRANHKALPKNEAIEFVEESRIPINFQPQKANLFRADNIDHQQRKRVKNSKPEAIRLTD